MNGTFTVPESDLSAPDALKLGLRLVEWACANGAADPMIVPLTQPLVRKGKDSGVEFSRVDEVKIVRPGFGDVCDSMDAGGRGAATLHLLSACTGLSVADLRSLTPTDGERLSEAVAPFLP